MGFKDRRSNIKWGRYSSALVLPASLEKGEESTLAGNRLLLVDPRAEISEEDLLEFLEKYVEPQFWPWYQKKKEEIAEKQANQNNGISVDVAKGEKSHESRKSTAKRHP